MKKNNNYTPTQKVFSEAKECFIDSMDIKNFINLDSSIFYLEKIKEALSKPLKIVTIYGEPGVGKTILLNKLKWELSEKNKNVHIFLEPILEEKSFYSTLFSKIFKKEMKINFDELMKIITKLNIQTHTFILDEAQVYPMGFMEKVRLLSNTEKIKFIICIHHAQKENLLSQEHFQSRMWENIEIKPVKVNELEIYIKKKLLKKNLFMIANLFGKKETKFIYRFTKGNYRNTNKFLYSLFEILEYYELKEPNKINFNKIPKKIFEMNAIKLEYINA